MKAKKGMFSLVCAFACAALLISLGTIVYNEAAERKEIAAKADIQAIESVSETKDSIQSCFILREHNGQIGIFSSDNNLLNTVDVAVITLPLTERQRLSNGIKVTSEKELYSLIEDYSG